MKAATLTLAAIFAIWLAVPILVEVPWIAAFIQGLR